MTCPHCGNDDESMMEEIGFVMNDRDPDHIKETSRVYLCEVCSKKWEVIINLLPLKKV